MSSFEFCSKCGKMMFPSTNRIGVIIFKCGGCGNTKPFTEEKGKNYFSPLIIYEKYCPNCFAEIGYEHLEYCPKCRNKLRIRRV